MVFIERILKLPQNKSFFLLGPRQTGKSFLLKASFNPVTTLYYNLLQSEEYARLTADPSQFRKEVLARRCEITHIIVDEVQRIPELLNEVHAILESENLPPVFALSGSSARKLKKTNANLLAGRALDLHLYPLTHLELKDQFDLDKALQVGTLPSVYLDPEYAEQTLKAYTHLYLEEEIKAEALVRSIGGFARFLELAAHENTNLINYTNIARETANKAHNIKIYFQILEDTLIGFMLHPYAKSERKRLVQHPKFYFFDTGVQRALIRRLKVPLQKKTSEYGMAFEHFVIKEIIHLSRYRDNDYRFSFYATSANAEVDLIVETPDQGVFAIEIKSTTNPQVRDLRGLKSFQECCPEAILLCASTVPHRRKEGDILICPWQEVFEILNLC